MPLLGLFLAAEEEVTFLFLVFLTCLDSFPSSQVVRTLKEVVADFEPATFSRVVGQASNVVDFKKIWSRYSCSTMGRAMADTWEFPTSRVCSKSGPWERRDLYSAIDIPLRNTALEVPAPPELVKDPWRLRRGTSDFSALALFPSQRWYSCRM